MVLIVDDERPSRGQLRFLLQGLAPEAAFHEASNGQHALQLVEQVTFDVVFVDINMPQMNGLALAAALIELPVSPLIIFATAHNQHALHAFELAALDYVVKPFTKARLQQTVTRIRQSLADLRRREQQQTAVQAFIQSENSPRFNRLWSERENGHRVLAAYEEIIYIEAKDKKVYLHVVDGTEPLLVRQTLKTLIQRLEAHHFCQTHKSFIVNLHFVAEIIPWFSGNFQIRLQDAEATTLPLSRRFAAQLRRRTATE